MPEKCTKCEKTVRVNQHAGDKVKMLPLAFVLMSRRRRIDYIKVFRKLKKLTKGSLNVKSVVGDFELAVWNALRRVFPSVNLRGCLFHMTPAVWKKCLDLGLAVPYREKETTHRFVRQLMCLPFLPLPHIRPVFEKLRNRVTGGKLKLLVDYIQRQWVDSTRFPPKSWCIYQKSIRTNNFIEGWHRRLNHRSGEQELGFYRLVPVLHGEASLVPLQTKLLKEGKVSTYFKRAASSRQKEIFSLWRDYKDGTIGVTSLLTKISRVHGPVV